MFVVVGIHGPVSKEMGLLANNSIVVVMYLTFLLIMVRMAPSWFSRAILM